MRRDRIVFGVLVGSLMLAPWACLSNDNPSAPATDAGTDARADTSKPFDAGDSSTSPDTSTTDAGAVDAPIATPDASDAQTASDASDASTASDAQDATAAPLVLTASKTNVGANADVTLTVTLNGITATSIEIDDGTAPIATFTAAPYEKVVSYTFVENGNHAYTAKATLANSTVVTSAVVDVVVNIAANGFFVDPVNGVDTNTGLQASPFKTISKAASLLTADGQSLYLAAGTYDVTTQTSMQFTFTHVTNVRGLGAGVVLTGIAAQGTGNAFTFNTGGDIRDVAIHNQYGGINVPGGTFHASNVAFDAVYDPYYIRGTTVATIDAGPITNTPGAALGATVSTDDGSTTTYNGGGATFDLGNKVINGVFVRGHSTLTINDYTITNCKGHGLVINDNGHVTLNNVSITSSGLSSSGYDSSVVAMGGQNTEPPMTTSLAINGGSISNNTQNAIVLTLYGTTAETPSITLTNTHFDSNAGNALWVNGTVTNAALAVTLSVTGTTFNANKGVGILAPRANVTMTGGSVSANTLDGIQLTDATSTNSLKIRGTTFGGNLHDAIDFNGTTASVLDLGKAGDLGGVVFTTVPATDAAVNLETAITSSAIGNTWMASQQGADANGMYTTPTTLTSSSGAGTNAKLVTGASLIVE